MKIYTLLMVLFLFNKKAVFAASVMDKNKKTDQNADYFVGPSIGIKNIHGFAGLYYSKRLYKPYVFCGGGIGASTWILKANADIQIFSKINRCGLSFGFGVGYVLGGKYKMPLDFMMEVNPTIGNLSKNQFFMGNCILGYHGKLGENSNWFVHIAATIPFKDPIKITHNKVNLSKDENEAIVNSYIYGILISPVGINSGLGVLFGF